MASVRGTSLNSSTVVEFSTRGESIPGIAGVAGREPVARRMWRASSVA